MSEFGTGLTYCLALFLQHESNGQLRRIYAAKRFVESGLSEIDYCKDKGAREKQDVAWFVQYEQALEDFETNGVQRWFHGASDHFYEMAIPEAWRGSALGNRIWELRDKVLDYGHGDYMRGGLPMTPEMAEESVREAKDILIEIDKALHVEAERADFE